LCAQDDPSVGGFNETLKKAMDTTRHNWARDMVASYLQGKYAGSGGSVWTEFFMPYPSKERADDAYLNVQQKLLKFWEIKFVNQSTEAGGPADLARYINQFRQRYPSLRVMAGENIPQLTRPDPFSPEKLSLVAESSLTRSGGPRDPRFQGVVAWWTRLRNDARDRTNPAQPEGWSMVDTSWERVMQTTEDYTSDAADSSAVDNQWVSDMITQGVGDAMKTAHLDTMYAEALGLAWGAGTGGPAGFAGSLPAETIESSLADVIDITAAIAEYAALKMVA
jgi:hypothetical protein